MLHLHTEKALAVARTELGKLFASTKNYGASVFARRVGLLATDLERAGSFGHVNELPLLVDRGLDLMTGFMGKSFMTENTLGLSKEEFDILFGGWH